MPGKNLTRLEAQARAAVVSNCSYEIELDLTSGLTASPPTFRSTTRLRFAGTKGEATFIDLIAPEVHSVVLNGVALDPSAAFKDSRIALPNLEHSNELVIEATCAYMNTGEGLHRFVDPEDGEIYLYSQFEVGKRPSRGHRPRTLRDDAPIAEPLHPSFASGLVAATRA